jgi:CSLREA domain-containing protein/uncharacterized repeat protein (TIGR01451 family)
VKNVSGISKRFSDSINRIFGIFVLSIGLAVFALPGLSQSPSHAAKDSVDSADSSRSATSLPSHRNKTVHTTASQPPASQHGGAAQRAPQGPKIWLQDTKRLPTTFSGTSGGSAKGPASLTANNVAQNNAIAMVLGSGQGQPLAMVKGDFDRDGIEDLVVGYTTAMGPAIAMYRGNLDAYAPQSNASFKAIARGEFPAPFLPQAKVLSVPTTPDFIATGDITGDGFQDIVIASRGGSVLYVLPGDGKGNFGAPQALSVSGGVTALATGEFGAKTPGVKIFVGTSGSANNSSLSVFSVSSGKLTTLGSFPLSGAASNIQFGDFGDRGPDAAFLSNGQVQILRASTMEMTTVPLPVSAAALALGSFVFDRNAGSQIAVLATDGSVHIVARNEFDPRPFTVQEFAEIRHARVHNQVPPILPARSFPANGWKVVESFTSIASVPPGSSPVFLRTRVSNNGSDDIMWINGSSGQMAVISHANSKAGASTFAPGQVSTRPYSGPALNAIPMRINVDGRPGIVALHQGDAAPYAVMPIPDPTYLVNTTNDGVFAGACAAATANECTLREAILEANGDTIMVPAGTYTLTLPKVANDYSGDTGALYVNNSMTIVGAGQNTTIIQAGTLGDSTGTPNGVDMVMAVNEDIPGSPTGVTNASASISNLTLQNGHNRGTAGVDDGDGGCMEFDTGSSGTATLFLTNVTLNNCDTTQGNGGGIVVFNFSNPGAGAATIANSIIQNNSAVNSTDIGNGGGIWVADPGTMIMTNTQVINNKATQSLGGVFGSGGGIYLSAFASGSSHSQIHASTISGNTAEGAGGGIWGSTNLTVDQGTSIKANVAGSDGSANAVGGGGIYYGGINPDDLTLSMVTITGNSATGNGGGIAIGGNGAVSTLTMSYSRLAANSSTANSAGKNLWNGSSLVTATENWWGTNNPGATLTGANTSGPNPDNSFVPFLELSHSASPAKIQINQSATLTAGFLLDNQGGAISPNNLTAMSGVPITFNGAVLGTIPQTQPEAIGAAAATITTATESSNVVTITTSAAHGFTPGTLVTIAGVTNGSYDGVFTINSTPTPTTFVYTDNDLAAGFAPSGGGTASVALGSATATFNAGAIGGLGSANAVVDQQTVTANITILQPPSITKAFSPAMVLVNAPSTITFTLTNGNSVTINGSFADTLATNLVVAATPAVVNNCGGSITATAGASAISFLNASLPVGVCTITVNVQATTDGVFANSVTIDSTDAGNGNTAAASPSLTVINPPSIAEVFGAATIPLNGVTTLTYTITNSNANTTFTGLAFTDAFPAGLLVGSPNNLNNTCGGAVGASQNSGSVILSGGTLAPGASCTLSVNVHGTTAGIKTETVQVSSTNGGAGNTVTPSITVIGPPVIIKAFGGASIPLNALTSLTFTIQNNNTTQSLSGIAFTDTLPAGLVISTPNSLAGTGTCSGGVFTATAGTNVVSMTTATLAQSSSCSFSLNVTGIAAGAQNNTTGAVSSTQGGTGGTASASVAVVAPPTIVKSFNPTTISVNGITALTLVVTNPAANSVAETGVAFIDTLPTGLVVATPNALFNTCGGTATATAGTTGISFVGGSVATNTACEVVVNVKGAVAGQYTNITGAISSTNGGTGTTSLANLTVAAPPSIIKAFGAPAIQLNGTTSLTFNIQNPNAGATLSGVAFTDSLPAGVVIATPTALTNTCNGTATAVPGSSSASLAAGTLAVSASCTITVNVTGTTAGVKNNSVQVTSTEGGTGNTSNATVTVVAPPVIIKAFGAASVPLSGTTSLSFTIQNNNATQSLSGIGFTDTIPAGLVISTPNGLSGTCGGGVITAVQGTSVIITSGATIAQSSSCTFSVNVTGTSAGQQNNTTSAVTSTEGGTGGTASASVAVVAPPTIAKAFNPTTIALNGTTTLTFTISNPAANTVAEAGVAFIDTMPTGLVVAAPNGLSSTCNGTATATAGTTGVSLAAGSIATPNTTCTVIVNVTGAAAGVYTNTSGSVSSTNGGAGNTASANLTVAAPPTIAKTFGAATIPLNGATSLTFNVTNPNATVALTGVAFTDNLPAGVIIATPNALTNTCGGTAAAIAGSGQASLATGTLAVSASCTITVNVTGSTAGVKNNSVQVTSTQGGTGNTSNASITVVGPPVIIKSFGAASIPLNGTTSLNFTIQNNNATQSLSGIAFTDTLPAGLVIATPNGLAGTGTCTGGVFSATQGTNLISMTGATLALSSSCTFSLNVTGSAAGQQNNTTGAVTSVEGGTGGTASASVIVVAPPSIAKVFGASSVPLNGTTSLTITITNPASNTVAEAGVAFADTLPTGLVVTTPNALTNTCNGVATATAGTTAISLAGGSIATPAATCVITLNVTGAVVGNYTNITGAVSSTNGGAGNTATAPLAVAVPPAIVKAFGASTIPLNGTTTLTFNIQNPNTVAPLAGLAFTDSLPAGLVVAPTPNLTSTCGGTSTAAAGSASVTLAAGTLPVSMSCLVSVNVQGAAIGVKNNSVQITSTTAGNGNTSNASITVVGPPLIIKAFGAATIPVTGTASLSFTIQNNNATQSLSGIAFSDTLPAGLVIATPNGIAGTGTCTGGVFTATQGTNVVSMTGATLALSSSCTFTVNVTGTAAGAQNNTTGAVTSVEGGTGGTASASISVVAPPVIAKAFNPTTIAINTNSTLTITITNPAANTVAETGVAFIDTLPAGLVMATPNALTNTCGGAVTATAGSGSVSLVGGTIGASSGCAITVATKGTARGSLVNVTGAVSSTNGGTGLTATATIAVLTPDLTITKSHSGNFLLGEIGATYSLTVNNIGLDPTLGTVTAVDVLPAGLTATAISGTGWTCTLGTLTCTRNDALAASASYPPITVTVNVAGNAVSPVTNNASVSGGGEANLANDTATDSTTLTSFTVGAAVSTMTATSGQTITYNITLSPVGGSVTTVVTFTGVTNAPQTTLSFNPAQVTPGANPATTVLTVKTTKGKGFFTEHIKPNTAPFAAILFPMGLVFLVGIGAGKYKNNKKVTGWIALILVVSVLGMGMLGCASNNVEDLGTAPGTYVITVTATSGAVQQSVNLTLVVQ